MFKGYLTFTMAAAAVVVGILMLCFGWYEAKEAIVLIWAGVGMYGVRRALPK